MGAGRLVSIATITTRNPRGQHEIREGGNTMGLDPVCKMEVNPASAEAQSQYQGQTFYFCSVECKRKFDAHPEQYIDETDRAHGKAHRAQQAPNR
jgi:YHS domain-containing protein